MAEFKTNVYRIFDSAKLPYTPHTYEHEEGVAVDGVTVAGEGSGYRWRRCSRLS